MHLHRSRSCQLFHAVCMVFVLAYVLFDVLDLDGSRLSAVVTPVERAAIMAEPVADLEVPHRHGRTAISSASSVDPDAAAAWSRPHRTSNARFTPLYSTRAHGYRVGLPRDAVPG